MATIRLSIAFLVLCTCCLLIGARRNLPLFDVVHDQSPFLHRSVEENCEQTYGFLPCTTKAAGNVFLIVVYGYLMFLAATFLSNGSELLLEILGPGLIGGLFLPMLGALPDAMLILVSGISGSKETAQSQVSVGMGLLAGSTVMLITVIWGSCVICGKCDLQDAMAVDFKDTSAFSLTRSGVTTDIWTSYAAVIMGVSVIPFLIVQLPQLLHSTSGRHIAVLVALIVSLCLLVSYCVYQVFQPWVQKRRIEYAKHKHFISGILRHLKMQSLGRLIDADGNPDIAVIEKLFEKIDTDGDGRLTLSELRAFVVGIRFDEIDLDKDKAVEKVMREFDTSENDTVERDEFFRGIACWLNIARGVRVPVRDPGPYSVNPINDFHWMTRRENQLLVHESCDGGDDADGDVRRTSVKAVMLLILGTAVAAAFADPLVDAVDGFSEATSIPTFFISFIALPLATNASESLSAIIFARRKTRRTASLTFSELYGAVTMNNVLCLSVFLALVYARGLTWDFSSEVLVIVVVCVVVAAVAGARTTFPLWFSFCAFALYPLSLLLVYILDYVLGWS